MAEAVTNARLTVCASSTAMLSELYAVRTERWIDDAGVPAPRPVFMAAVASVLGTSGATATLRGRRRVTELVAASDAKARAAHDLELVLAEGPATDAATRETSTRWLRWSCSTTSRPARQSSARTPTGPLSTRQPA